jgi:hypothetical protein
MSAIPHIITQQTKTLEQLLLIPPEVIRTPFIQYVLNFFGYHLEVAMLEGSPYKQHLIHFLK